MPARRLLPALIAVTLAAGCGGDAKPPPTVATCGVDPTAWREAATRIDIDPGDVQRFARRIARSGCLVGGTRADVTALLGGAGDSYWLGGDPTDDGETTLEITYDGDEVSGVTLQVTIA